MAELALGAMGLIPLIGVSFKSYRSVYSKVKAFRNCSHDLANVCTKLRRCRVYFHHECSLLLRFALDEESVKAMSADPDHENWAAPDLESALRASLGSGYEICESLAESISQSLQQFEEEVRKFEDLTKDPQQAKGDNRGGSMRRLKKRVRAAFNKTKYESMCKELRESNLDLTAAREQIAELQYPSMRQRRALHPRSRGNWGAMCRVRGVSMALHQGFQETWSCADDGHTEHSIRMFLDFEKAKQQSNLAIAIVSGRSRKGTSLNITSLEVRSEKLEWADTSQPTPEASPDTSQAEVEQPRKKAKSVRFAQPRQSSSSSSLGADLRAPTTERGAKASAGNLKHSADVCLRLSTRLAYSSLAAGCLGYFDVSSEENFRHTFYSLAAPPTRFDGPSSVVPLNEVLNISNLGYVSVQDRLKVARTVAIAALTYHCTPWLGECWRLGDLHFIAETKDPSACFQTLHLAADLQRRAFASGAPAGGTNAALTPPDSAALARSSEGERLLLGVHNLTLHSLGVALLGIDRWQELDPSDLVGVRRAARSTMIGPKYQDVVRKCLGCEFRYGHDLGKPKLQRAVYEGVVGTLEDMIASLDIDEG